MPIIGSLHKAKTVKKNNVQFPGTLFIPDCLERDLINLTFQLEFSCFRCLPEDEPIDLLNVAFEQKSKPHVEKSSKHKGPGR